MTPTLFQLGPLPIHSFGLLMVLAFLSAWRLLALSLKEAGHDPARAEHIIFWTAIGGIIGGRLGYIVSYPGGFFADPLGTLFSGAGFVFYGGFIGGAFAGWLYAKKEKISFLQYTDFATPALALGYAVGRVGCQLSGDGDYGRVSELPWAMSYQLGIVPTPPGVLVHPAPVYESIAALLIAFLLLYLQRNQKLAGYGQMFGLYLILSALARFSVEFVRIEPYVLAGFTQAQVVGVVLLLLGLLLLFRVQRQGS